MIEFRRWAPVWLGALLLIASAPQPAPAQQSGWRTWRSAELGLAIQRPPELYELDPESPADDINGEVEWGPQDQGWTIVVTSQKPKRARDVGEVAAQIRRQQPRSEVAEIAIGDGVKAARAVMVDADTFSTLVYFFDRGGTMLIAIELSIPVPEPGKDLAALRAAHASTIALFERILATVRLTAK